MRWTSDPGRHNRHPSGRAVEVNVRSWSVPASIGYSCKTWGERQTLAGITGIHRAELWHEVNVRSWSVPASIGYSCKTRGERQTLVCTDRHPSGTAVRYGVDVRPWSVYRRSSGTAVRHEVSVRPWSVPASIGHNCKMWGERQTLVCTGVHRVQL